MDLTKRISDNRGQLCKEIKQAFKGNTENAAFYNLINDLDDLETNDKLSLEENIYNILDAIKGKKIAITVLKKIKGRKDDIQIVNKIIKECESSISVEEDTPLHEDTKEYLDIASKQEYEKLLYEINILRKHNNAAIRGKQPESIFHIKLDDKINELRQKEFDCVIVHGPQLTGKRTLVKNYLSMQSKGCVIAFDGTNINNTFEKKRSTDYIFASWLQTIYEGLLSFYSKNPEVSSVLNDYQSINTAPLETYRKYKESIEIRLSARNYTGFDVLNDFFEKRFKEANIVINNNTKIVIEFAISNFQKMFTVTLYENFKNELIKYIRKVNRKASVIEFIIITRFIDPQIIDDLGERKIVVNTRFFNEKEIGQILSPLCKAEKITKRDFLTNFFEYTNGYPYFVIKLIYLYIFERLERLKSKDENRQPPPLDLLKYIFNTEKYWLTYGTENNERACNYLTNIISFINLYKKRSPDKLQKYLEIIRLLSSSDNDKSRIYSDINDFISETNDYYANDIIVSSGIFKIDFDNYYEAKGFGNLIIEKYIMPKLYGTIKKISS